MEEIRMTMKGRRCLLLTALVILTGASAAQACTTFVLDDVGRPVFGRNYDWSVEDALVIVNKRDVMKLAFLLDPLGNNPAPWVSKYGSVTFNQISREYPCGGMNEAGLVVEVMVLGKRTSMPQDGRPTVNNLQWVQYQLDNFATVAEVLGQCTKLRVVDDAGFALHYLVADRKGNAAALEVIDGKFICHTGNTMPAKVLANDTYEDHVDFMKSCSGFGGKEPIPGGTGSLSRFVRAAKAVRQYMPGPDKSAVSAAFAILDDVSQSGTVWSIVYDITGKKIHFRTKAQTPLRMVDLARMDFSCKTPVKVLDINAPGEGDMTGKFADYSLEANRKLIQSVFGRLDFLRPYRELASTVLAAYPDTTLCATR
jgi:choloylglycine hydrolase